MKTAQAVQAPAFNPYASPKAAVRDEGLAKGEAVFFPVGLAKLTVLSITLLGFYQIYWFYKNWKCVQRNYGDNLNAPIRAIFYPLVAYPLFKRVREHAEKAGVYTRLQAGMLAAVLFALGFAWRLPDPYWFAGFAAFLPLLPVQLTVNELNYKLAPQAETNRRLSGWNIAGVLLGALIIALALIGTFVPE
jgi:hypothetical protein